MATVFDAFPNAIVKDDWKLGELVENTDTGKLWKDLGYKSVIVDEGGAGDLDAAPGADGLTSDTLIYAMPSELIGFNVGRYIASYYWYQKSADQYYRIIDVGVGKNQQNGVIEHIEFRVRPAEFAGEADGDS